MNTKSLLLYLQGGEWCIAHGEHGKVAQLQRNLADDPSARLLISTVADVETTSSGVSVLRVSEGILQGLILQTVEMQPQ